MKDFHHQRDHARITAMRNVAFGVSRFSSRLVQQKRNLIFFDAGQYVANKRAHRVRFHTQQIDRFNTVARLID